MDPLFHGVAEATEEAILNSLCAAETTVGREGRVATAIPLDRVQALVTGSSPR
jgi:D-aminopeptidase